MSARTASGGVRSGIPFLVAAPSGTGKTTVCRAVVERDSLIDFCISHTTRPPRPGERDGVDYHFVQASEFRSLVAAGGFLEHAEYAGRLYGTSWTALHEPLARGRDLILEIEVQGARQVREEHDAHGLAVRFLFLLPPSLAELERRLRDRGTDSDEAIDLRLALVDRELEAARFFDYAVVNDDLEEAIAKVREIIEAEREGRPEPARARHGREVVLQRWEKAADSQ